MYALLSKKEIRWACENDVRNFLDREACIIRETYKRVLNFEK